MRKRGRTDANQAAIVKRLRERGASVLVLSGMGRGCPDVLVGSKGKNYLLELKDGSRPPSERKLTPDEAKWIALWAGHVKIANNEQDALIACGLVETDRRLNFQGVDDRP